MYLVVGVQAARSPALAVEADGGGVGRSRLEEERGGEGRHGDQCPDAQLSQPFLHGSPFGLRLGGYRAGGGVRRAAVGVARRRGDATAVDMVADLAAVAPAVADGLDGLDAGGADADVRRCRAHQARHHRRCERDRERRHGDHAADGQLGEPLPHVSPFRVGPLGRWEQ